MYRIFRQIIPAVVYVLCAAGLAQAQNVNLTFRVDMQYETVSPDGVNVAGSFQTPAGFGANWNPGGTPMSDLDGDGIYERTVSLPPGVYQYKFVTGNAWQDKPEMPQPECSLNDGGGNYNRQVTVGSAGVNLPVVQFDSCNAFVRLQINMKGLEISEHGVHVMGDFQEEAGFGEDWDPASVRMADLNSDGTYEIELQIPHGTYHYLFVNGNTIEEAESVDAACTVVLPDYLARQVNTFTSHTAGNTVYCFSTCTNCDPSIDTEYPTEWWNDAVFYEIFVRSFYDSDGDGMGDFRGIIEKLDYLNDGDSTTSSDLGITGIWLMPIFSSPTYHGYDAADFYSIEPDYGTMEDFEDFLDAAHERGIRVIIDFMMNHVSSENPWFTQSAISSGGFRDWFIWEDTNPGYTGPWGQEVWHHRHGDYYYGLFWSGMPDLNYSHMPVKEAMFDVTQFWLDKGVDGFRLDAIKYLDEDGTTLEDTPETFEILEEFRTLYKSLDPDAVTVGEVWSTTNSVLPYVQENRLDLCFEFDLAFSIVNSVNAGEPSAILSQLDVVQSGYRKLQYATFLSNHDINRVFSTLGNDIRKMKQAAALYLTLPGVPFVYYGEEVGMQGTGAHENIRTPMQWTNGIHAGFTTGIPWQQVGLNYPSNNVGVLEGDSVSLLNHYRSLIHIRNGSAPLRRGYLLKLVTEDDRVIAYSRIYRNEAVVVVSNFRNTPVPVSISQTISSLVPGEYEVTEVLSGLDFGSVVVDAEGGFDSWQPATELLNPGETWVFRLKAEGSTSTGYPAGGVMKPELRPNPVSDKLVVLCNDQGSERRLIQIIDINGRVLSEVYTTDRELTIDVSDLPAGLYYVKLQMGAGQGIAEFIKVE